METILKKGSEKIINLFYKDKYLNIHLRDIARKTNLNENSASRFLKQLEEQQILTSKKQGNLKNYSIEKNKNVFVLFSFFDIKKYNKLPSIRKNAVNYFFENLKEKPILVVLFGSTAKENFTKNSDLDLLLVVNKKIKTNDAENYVESQTGININCFQVSFNDFIKEIKIKQDKVIQSAVKSGYPLINHIYYYEVVLK
jgi:predicted nucleotidyltransferase/predicted transcriptional regulator